MIAVIVNFISIIIGSIIGIFLKNGIPKRVKESVFSGLALCVLYIGISGSLKTNNVLTLIISIVIGTILGELIDIDKRITSLGNLIESKFKNGNDKISEGFITSSLLFCVGAMAIVGSLEAGLDGNYKTLFAKSVIDGVSAIIFSSSLGIGVMISSISVLVYQGAITLGAVFLKSVLTSSVIADMTGIGSLLIIGLALNMLNITKIKIANLLPSVFMPIFAYIIYTNFHHFLSYIPF
jgi:hypothetical protein